MRKTLLICTTLLCILLASNIAEAQCSYTSTIMGWTMDFPEYWTLKIINSSKGKGSIVNNNNDDVPPPPLPNYKDVITDSSDNDTPPPRINKDVIANGTIDDIPPPIAEEPAKEPQSIQNTFKVESVSFTYYDGSIMVTSASIVPYGVEPNSIYNLAINQFAERLKKDGVTVDKKKKRNVTLGGKTFEKYSLKVYRGKTLEQQAEILVWSNDSILWVTLIKFIQKDKDNYDVMMNVLAQAAKDSKL